MTGYYDRPESRQRALLDIAEQLLAAKKASIPRRTTTNEHFASEPPKPPTPDEVDRDAMASELVRRLAIRDKGLGD